MKEKNLKQIYTSLFEFSNLFHQKFSPVFRRDKSMPYSCNKNQNKTIMILARYEKITPTHLGKCLDLRKGSLTTLIDSLVTMGLVHRTTDKQDRRKNWLSLTLEGKQYLKLKEQALEASIIKGFSGLDEDEIEAFASNLKDIVRIMNKL